LRLRIAPIVCKMTYVLRFHYVPPRFKADLEERSYRLRVLWRSPNQSLYTLQYMPLSYISQVAFLCNCQFSSGRIPYDVL
jgi:hypothetical protein